MTLHKAAMFMSYTDFAEDYKRCRSTGKGRPIKGWCRLFREGSDYVVKIRRWHNVDVPLFRVSPDETVTFCMPLDSVLHNAQTIVSSLYRVIPFSLERKRKGIYALGDTHRANDGHGRSNYFRWLKTEAPEYFTNIRFNLVTGECLNPQPNLMDSVIPEVRTQWLRHVKRYKKGLKARAKVGALQGYMTKVADTMVDRHNHWKLQHDWNRKLDHHETLQQVVECMRSEEYPPDLLYLFVATTPVPFSDRDITAKMVLRNVDRVFNAYSVQLRQIYGVFGVR
jgi:hypothetical protein